MANYTKPTISNYNDNPPSNDGSENFVDNGVDWDKNVINEVGDPLKNYIDAVNNETDTIFDTIEARGPVNVKDDPYNAVGDGVTDDTAGLQAAIDYAQTNNSDLYIPAGEYLISSALEITTAITLRGAGGAHRDGAFRGTRIFTDTASINLLEIDHVGGSGNKGGGGSIEKITFDGNSKAAIGLNITGALTTEIAFRDLSVISCTHLGVYLGSNHSFNFYSCVFRLNGVTSDAATDAGIQMSGVNTTHFWGCVSESNWGSGVIVDNGYNNAWHGGTIEGNRYHGVIISDDAQRFTMDNIYFELNNNSSSATTYDVYIVSGTNSYCNIIYCRFSGGTTTNCIYNNGVETHIINCRDIGTINNIFWGPDAYAGVFIGSVKTQIDTAGHLSDPGVFAAVVDSFSDGFDITTPAMPANFVFVENSTNVAVDVYITAVGTTTAWAVQDAANNVLDIAGAVTLGYLCRLQPGYKIRISYSVAPTWTWGQS